MTGEPCHFHYVMLSKTVLEEDAAMLTALEIAGMQQSAQQIFPEQLSWEHMEKAKPLSCWLSGEQVLAYIYRV